MAGFKCGWFAAVSLSLLGLVSASVHRGSVAKGTAATAESYPKNGTDFILAGLGQNCTIGGNITKPMLCDEGLFCEANATSTNDAAWSNPNSTLVGVCQQSNLTDAPPPVFNNTPPGTPPAARADLCFVLSNSTGSWARACSYGLECLAMYPFPNLASSEHTAGKKKKKKPAPSPAAYEPAPGDIAGFCLGAFECPRLDPFKETGKQGGRCRIAPSAAASASDGEQLCEKGLSCVEPSLQLSEIQWELGIGVCVSTAALARSLLSFGASMSMA